MAVYNACVQHALGDASEPYEADDVTDLYPARMRLLDAVFKQGDTLAKVVHAACKRRATNAVKKDTVTVRTKAGGTIEMHVPQTYKQVLDAPDSTEWIAVEMEAMKGSILCMPGNSLIADGDQPSDAEVDDMTTTRVIKVDKQTGELEKRKARHSVDEARKVRKSKRARDELEPAYLLFGP